MEEQNYPKNALDKFRQWHFWWLVVFSLFLIVTFVYYLPARFLNQIASDNHMDEQMMEEMHDDMHGENEMDEDGDMTKEQMMSMMEEYYEEPEVKSGLVVNLNIFSELYAGNLLSLDFRVKIKPNNNPVAVSALDVEHEKLMHVIGIRSDLNEFFHVHPVQSSAINALVTEHVFKKPGIYKIWSEVKKDGIAYTFGHPEISIEGVGSRTEKNVSFSRNVILGAFQISLQDDRLVAGDESELSFSVNTLTGQGVELENYLGEPMHFVLIKDDLKTIIHTHPYEDSHANYRITKEAWAHGVAEDEHVESEPIKFSVKFSEPGLYKGFAQFRPKGMGLPEDEALLAEFWFQVEEKKAFSISPWWGLLVVSTILIIILNWIVSRYINVKNG